MNDSAILFTDIEGSTRLWEHHPERMSSGLAQHDLRSRAAVESNGGLVVKTTGDGMCAVFRDPVDAIKATLALQHALADSEATLGIPIRVRCGLHYGQVERRDNDVFGNTVNRTARIMDAAHGGQVLISDAIFQRVRERLPPQVDLVELGSVRLADLALAERVYQVFEPGLRQKFPPLRSLESTPNNLPQQLTSFVGREREIAESRELLRQSRLLTLLGMGGLGKTRLSLQLGADALDQFPEGAWFIDLAPITDARLVPSEVANVLGVQEQPGGSLTQTLCEHLKRRAILIILDNCEHLIGACADLAAAMLRAAPGLRIIATSREALRVPGEVTYPVLPLPLPDPAADVDTLSRSDAVRLFVDRACLHRPSFRLSASEAPAVAELCTRLEGIPLALELAAARMRALSVAEINVRLRDRFKLLTGGGRVLLARQQTLRALVDWSYDLLQESERVLLARLSVFAGNFTLAAAETICNEAPLDGDDLLDILTSLVDKSLVMAEQVEESSRYRMLETIRDYAREKLASRAELEAVARRHCDYFLAMAKDARKGLRGEEQGLWTRRVEDDLDNLRAAIALALTGGIDPVVAVKIEVALMHFRILRGYATEGRNNIKAALARPEVIVFDVAHGHALYVGAGLAESQSDYADAERLLKQCLDLRRHIDNKVDLAATLSTLSKVRLPLGDPGCARVNEEEALQIFRELGHSRGEAISLLHLGQISLYERRYEDARASFEQSIAIARGIKHCETESEGERLLGEIALECSDLPGARARFARSLTVCRGAGDKRDEAISLWWMGKTDLAAGDTGPARERLGAALQSFQAFEMYAEILGCLEDHATLNFAEGNVALAATLCVVCEHLRQRLALLRTPRDDEKWRYQIARIRAAAGEPAFQRAQASAGAGLSDIIRAALAARAPPPPPACP